MAGALRTLPRRVHSACAAECLRSRSRQMAPRRRRTARFTGSSRRSGRADLNRRPPAPKGDRRHARRRRLALERGLNSRLRVRRKTDLRPSGSLWARAMGRDAPCRRAPDGRLLPAQTYPAQERSRRGAVKGSPSGPAEGRREAVSLDGFMPVELSRTRVRCRAEGLMRGRRTAARCRNLRRLWHARGGR
jgi:hypothetical protein